MLRFEGGVSKTTIISPDRTKYNLEGKIVEEMFYNDRSKKDNPNSANLAKAKIYILTSIIDKPNYWCHDLTKIPPNGEIKVIFSNGTIRKLDFKGVFLPSEIISKREEFLWEPDYDDELMQHQISRSFSWVEGPHCRRIFVNKVYMQQV